MKTYQLALVKLIFFSLMILLACHVKSQTVWSPINKNADVRGSMIIRNNQIVGDSGILPSAVAEFRSRTKGILVPRMSAAQMAAISSPDSGLLVYNTSVKAFHYFNGSAWVEIGGGGNSWSLDGNTGTTSANKLGTLDGQPLYIQSDSFVRIQTDSAVFYMGNSVRAGGTKKISGFEIKSLNGNGIYGSIYFLNTESDGGPFTAMNIELFDSTNGTKSLFEMNRGQVEIEVTDDAGNTGNCKVTAGTFNAGDYNTSGQQYLFTDWEQGYFSIGNTANFLATIFGEEAQSKLYAYSNNGFSFKNVTNPSNLNESDSITIRMDSVAIMETNLPAIQFGNAITYFSSDSATIYATTPTPGTTYYCNNCSGNGVTGRLVCYIGSLWRRLKFD
ncbi:MAG: hypothetical protein U0T74_05895 [Chitinophagales bacterium]